MFDKNKCKMCKHRSNWSGGGGVHCNYSHSGLRTCLRLNSKGKIYDARGTDPDNCKLFEEGRP